MTEQCPECATPIGDDPWCGNCGAHLAEVASTGSRELWRPSPRASAVAALLVVLVLAVLSWPDPTDDAEVGLAEPVVPVEEQTILPPQAPPAPAQVQRQFAAEGRVLEERPRGDEPLPTLPPDDLVFTSAEGSVDVDVVAGGLQGVVDGDVAWERVLDEPLVGAPVRTGTSILVLLADGSVASLDPGDGSSWWERTLDAVPTAVAGDGTLLLVGTADGQVLRLDPSGNVVTTIDVGPGAVEAIVVDRPARIVLSDRVVEVSVDG